MLDTTLVNAYIMYIEPTPDYCLLHMYFLLEVARDLINEQSTMCFVPATPQDFPKWSSFSSPQYKKGL